MTDTPDLRDQDRAVLEAASCAQHHGVYVSELGEDMDEIAVFTHDRRRALAAASAHLRYVAGHHHGYRLVVGKPRWCATENNCGCGDTCPSMAQGLDFCDCDCDIKGLGPCGDEWLWCLVDVPESSPAAIPTLVLEVQ